MRINRCEFCGSVALVAATAYDQGGAVRRHLHLCLSCKRALLRAAAAKGVGTDDRATARHLLLKLLASAGFIALLAVAFLGFWRLLDALLDALLRLVR